MMIVAVALMAYGGFEILAAILAYMSMSEFERYMAGDQMSSGLVVGIPVFIIGLVLFNYAKHKQELKDSEMLAENLKNRDTTVCPSCGLNISPNTSECPQCHTKLGGSHVQNS